MGLAGALGYEARREAIGEEEEASAECSPGGAQAPWGALREPDSAVSTMVTLGR